MVLARFDLPSYVLVLVLAGQGLELDIAAGVEEGGRLSFGIEEGQGCTSDELPAAGAFDWIDPCLGFCNADGAGWDGCAGSGTSGGGDSGGHASEVREARCEAHHIDQIFGARVNIDDLLWGNACAPSHDLEVWAVLAAVEDWEVDDRCGVRWVCDGRTDVGKLGFHVVVGSLCSIVLNEDGSVGWDDVHDSRDALVGDGLVEVVDAAVALGTDLVSEFYDDGAISSRYEFRGFVHGGGSIPVAPLG